MFPHVLPCSPLHVPFSPTHIALFPSTPPFPKTGYYLLTWMFAADPTMITSVRWLARDSKNIMNKLTIVSMRACGIMGNDEDFDAESIKVLALASTRYMSCICMSVSV